MSINAKKYIPDPVVARERYHVSTRTLPRWDKTAGLNFPPPLYINGRKYRDEALLDQFDRERAARSAQDMADVKRRRQPREATEQNSDTVT
jgi:hypothetical protein